jgi:hypothetical protein
MNYLPLANREKQVELEATVNIEKDYLTPWSRVLEKLIVPSVSQEIPCLLWNLIVQYSLHECLPPVLILSQINPLHTLSPYFLKIYFVIILTFVLVSSKWSLLFRLCNQNFVCGYICVSY